MGVELLTFQDFSSPGERAGLALIALSGLLSALTTGALLIYLAWHGLLSRDSHSLTRQGVRSFVRSSLGCYLVSLLVCDCVQGATFSLNFHWARVGYMTEGQLCTIQGAISEVGDMGAAIWSLAISYHTFWLLFMVRRPHFLVTPVMLGAGWITLIILPILGEKVLQTPEKGSFYGLSGAWCWIGVRYGVARLLYLYAWVFLALGTSIITYALIYLRFANFITVSEKGGLTLNFRRKLPAVSSERYSGASRPKRVSRRLGCFIWTKDIPDGVSSSGTGSGSDSTGNPHVSNQLALVARRLMLYPILYAIVVLPASVCRMGVLAGWQPPFPLFVFAGITFSGSGISNSILFVLTRHSVIRHVAQTQTRARIQVTTQRITFRDEPGSEVDDMNLDPLKSPKLYEEIGHYQKNEVTIEMPSLAQATDRSFKPSIDTMRHEGRVSSPTNVPRSGGFPLFRPVFDPQFERSVLP